MAKLTLNDITGGYQTASSYNANNALIEAALENTVSRDGTAPNNMDADFDLNSNNVNNVADINMSGTLTATGTANVGALILDGTVVTVIEDAATVAAAPDATQVSYTPTNPSGAATTLQDALDDNYLRNDRDETYTGTLTVVGGVDLTGDLDTVGDLGITGNIVVSGTVDGVNVSDALIKPSAAAGHVRAGNTQMVTGEDSGVLLSITSSVTEDVYETVGPTGSGATNEWSGLDLAQAAGATILKFMVRLSFTTADTSGGSISFFACSGDVASPGIGNDDQLIARVSYDPNSAGASMTKQFPIEVPVNSSGVFKATWADVNGSAFSQVVELTYKGFITD